MVEPTEDERKEAVRLAAMPKPDAQLIELTEIKIGLLDSIDQSLKTINERQERDWQQHLRAKRRQVWIGVTMAAVAIATLSLDVVQAKDFVVLAERASCAVSAILEAGL